jgi:predicted dehydrogenase
MRKSRFFQRNAYISIDFLEKEAEIVQMRDFDGEPDPFAMSIELGEGKGAKEIFFEKPKIEANNAIKDELEAFAHAINTNTPPPVTIEDGYKALDIAYKIADKLKITTSAKES